MLEYLRNHWVCFLVGGVVGYCLHFCPLLCNCAGVCPVAGAACVCDDCSCDNCKCGVDCKDGCACLN